MWYLFLCHPPSSQGSCGKTPGNANLGRSAMSSSQTSTALGIVRGHFRHPKEVTKYPGTVKEKDISPFLCPAGNVLSGTFGTGKGRYLSRWKKLGPSKGSDHCYRRNATVGQHGLSRGQIALWRASGDVGSWIHLELSAFYFGHCSLAHPIRIR